MPNAELDGFITRPDGTLAGAKARVVPEQLYSLLTDVSGELRLRGIEAPVFKEVTGYKTVTGAYGGSIRTGFNGSEIGATQRAILMESGDFPEFDLVMEAVAKAHTKIIGRKQLNHAVEPGVMNSFVELAVDTVVRARALYAHIPPTTTRA